MSDESEIKKIFKKFVENQCNADEIEKMVSYCKTNKLTSEFPSVEEVKIWVEHHTALDDASSERIIEGILNHPVAEKVVSVKAFQSKLFRYTGIAASFLLLLSISWFVFNNFSSENEKIILDGSEITLQMEDGTIQIISADNTTTVVDAEGRVIGSQKGNSLIYETESKEDKLVYNTLTIPNGKRFQLQLADGTLVHLNAGSSLKYPVQFVGQGRKVFLNGEAFFDVKSDTKNPFVVNTDALNVRVLGTHFNVSNYPEDILTNVVLAEGSVSLYAADNIFELEKSTILKPGEMGSFSKNSKTFKTTTVNPEIYTAWIQGNLSYKNELFKNIIPKLERHYDVKIICKNAKLAETRFTASFKNEPISKVLRYFGELEGFNYTAKGKEITITY